MKLNEIKAITGRINLKSGLHIGAGDSELHIGGTDNPVVKHPFTQEPYIPGSSLKGKTRALLEMKSGLLPIVGSGKPLDTKILARKLTDDQRDQAIRILKLFGVSGADTQEMAKIGPSRASFADAFLCDESREQVRSMQKSYFEIKSENSIDRIKGVAQNPRFTERVVAGLSFDFFISLKVMDGDEDLLPTLLEGLKLLNLDALGGSGSRGYGRVEFIFHDKDIQGKFEDIKPF